MFTRLLDVGAGLPSAEAQGPEAAVRVLALAGKPGLHSLARLQAPAPLRGRGGGRTT